jgi:hypothetical protein
MPRLRDECKPFLGGNARAEIAEYLSSTLDIIELYVPAGRERALAITKLQEAQAWAEKGIK